MRKPWPANFPDVVTHTTTRIRDSHSDYEAAKAGDENAAARLIADLVDPGTVKGEVGDVTGRDVIVVPVRAVERNGENVIPDSYAAFLSKLLGARIDRGIIQTNIAGHTRAGGFTRLAVPAEFAGEVELSKEYVIVDDHIGMGGTVASLKGYIEDNGGRVVLATTLTKSRDSHHIALRLPTLQALRDKHRQALENFWTTPFGHGLDGLTEPEAQYLLRMPTVDRIRDRISEAAGS